MADLDLPQFAPTAERHTLFRPDDLAWTPPEDSETSDLRKFEGLLQSVIKDAAADAVAPPSQGEYAAGPRKPALSRFANAAGPAPVANKGKIRASLDFQVSSARRTTGKFNIAFPS